MCQVGPTADGRIATIFQERLLQMGAWLRVNGDAIYGSTMWREQNDTATHGVGRGVYYTRNGRDVFAHAMGWPEGNELHLRTPIASAATTVEMLGCSKPMAWRPVATALGEGPGPARPIEPAWILYEYWPKWARKEKHDLPGVIFFSSGPICFNTYMKSI